MSGRTYVRKEKDKDRGKSEHGSTLEPRNQGCAEVQGKLTNWHTVW